MATGAWLPFLDSPIPLPGSLAHSISTPDGYYIVTSVRAMIPAYACAVVRGCRNLSVDRGNQADQERSRHNLSILFGILVGFSCLFLYLLFGDDATPCTINTQLALLALSKKGYRLVFLENNNGDGLFASNVMDDDGSNVRSPGPSSQYITFNPQKKVLTKDIPLEEHVWSPNGKLIAVGRAMSGWIDITDADGSNSHRIFSPGRGVALAGSNELNWSPDGRFILFKYFQLRSRDEREDGYETSQLYVVDTESYGACRLTTNPRQNYKNPQWTLEKQP